MKTQAKPSVSAKRESWTVGVKALREDPEGRFKLACGHLPQKQAFREAAVALRALIREHCDDRGAVERYLAVLYRFAGLEALVYSRSSDHDEEGPAADEDLASRWKRMAEVSIPYAEVGCVSLSLLTKTDTKLMAQLWGEPNATTTPRAWFDSQSLEPTESDDRHSAAGEAAVAMAPHHRRATDVAAPVAVPVAVPVSASVVSTPTPGTPANPVKSGGAAPTLAEALAEEDQEAEDAIFRLMNQKRVVDAAGGRRIDRLVGWASRLRDAFGL